MKVQMTVNYSNCGVYELDNLSDEVLGAIVRGMMQQCRDEKNDYNEVSFRVAKLGDNGDEIPF